MVYFDKILHTYACQLACVTAFFEGRDFAEDQSGRSWSFSENAHNS